MVPMYLLLFTVPILIHVKLNQRLNLTIDSPQIVTQTLYKPVSNYDNVHFLTMKISKDTKTFSEVVEDSIDSEVFTDTEGDDDPCEFIALKFEEFGTVAIKLE